MMDNYAADKKAEVHDWIEANPRTHFHFTPTSRSWLNLAEAWFETTEEQVIHRGTFASVKDLTTKIRAFITATCTPPGRFSTRWPGRCAWAPPNGLTCTNSPTATRLRNRTNPTRS